MTAGGSVDFEQIFRRVPGAFMVLDRELRYLAANDAYLALVATSREQLIGRAVFEVASRDANDLTHERRLRESFARVLATGEPDVVASIAQRWSHTPILDDTGRVVSILQHVERVTAGTVETRDATFDRETRLVRHVVEEAPAFVCLLRGPQHVFELVNAAYMQLVGHRDPVGLPVATALPEIVGQGFIELLDGVYTSGQAFVGMGIPILLQRTPGAEAEPRFMDFTYRPVRDSEGRVSGIFVFGTDVTEQHEAARARGQLATIVEQSGDFIAAVDMRGKLLFVNESGRTLMGIGDRALADIDAYEFFFPSDRPFIDATITPALLERGRWHGELRMRHLRTNEPIPVDYNVFMMTDAAGKPAGVASVTRDLRAAKAAEQERLFLSDALPVHVWTAAPAGAVTYVNQRMVAYFGARREELLKGGWPEYMHPQDSTAAIERWRKCVESGEPYDVELRLRNAAGEYRWHLVRGLALRDERGVITKWYGTNSDIDDQRRGAEERERLISALAASNRELDRFAYVASHDLKTPLRGIGNLAQWIEDDAGPTLSDESRGHLQLMRGRVARMDALIDGVLRYSRSMKPDDHVQEVDVRDLIDVVVDLLGLPPRAKVVVEEGMPVLRTLYVALQQVFLNLIGNAVKHSGREDVEVRVSARHDGGPFHVFSVSDNGAGISPEHYQRIWGLFQTLDTAPRGQGIGLSVVKRLVELQGGTVDVERSDAGGAIFRFSWPTDAIPTPLHGTPAVKPAR